MLLKNYYSLTVTHVREAEEKYIHTHARIDKLNLYKI